MFARSLALAAALLLLAPTTAFADSDDKGFQPVLGPIYFGLEGQSLSGKGLMAGPGFVGSFDNFEMDASALFYPQEFTKFASIDAAFMLAPSLAGILPIDIRPMAGFEFGMYIDNFVGSSSADGANNAYGGLPLGVRISQGLGGLMLSAEAVYHYQLFDLLPTQGGYSTSRWHYEADAHMGPLAGGVYYETGAFWSGPGAKVGMNF